MATSDKLINKTIADAAAGVNMDVVALVEVGVAVQGATTGTMKAVRVICGKRVTEIAITEMQFRLESTVQLNTDDSCDIVPPYVTDC